MWDGTFLNNFTSKFATSLPGRRPYCLCEVYKCLFLRNLKLNSINVATLAGRIHFSAKKLSDCELKEQTVQKCETEELPQSTENSNFGRLHIPVMLEEVVSCISPQPGQVS
uniref:Uncharacterized protein n=1 Tax=Accipiter nisus TaxID=211598 RepID=A0A8B9NU27_9AVES